MIKRFFAALAIAVMALFGLVAAATPAHATCWAEPFAGDVAHSTSSVRYYATVVAEGHNWNIPRGWTSDSVITSCKDVDFIYNYSGYNIQQYRQPVGWYTWVTSTGWHKIGTANMTVRYVYD